MQSSLREGRQNVKTNKDALGSKAAVCEVCGNAYDKCFEVKMGGKTHVFDSFECAIHALAPKCAHCGCRIVGHGMETVDAIFCCAHCAGQHGITSLEDRVEERSTA
jgi:hypothetical protein